MAVFAFLLMAGCQAVKLPGVPEAPPTNVGATAANPDRGAVKLGGSERTKPDGLAWLNERSMTVQFAGRLAELVPIFARWGVSLVVPPEQAETGVQLSAKNMNVRNALRSVASHLGPSSLVASRGGEVVYVGPATPADQEVRVYHVPAKDVDQWAVALATIRDGVTVNRAGDALVAYGPRGSLGIVDDAIEALSGLRGQWAVDVRFVELNETAAESMGIDWELTGNVALGAMAAAGGSATSALAAVDLVGMLEAASESGAVRILTTARLHVVEGDEAELQLGETTPVARRSISDAGTSTVQSFESVDTGVLLRVAVRTAPNGLLRVDAEPEVSQITGFLNDAPIRSRRRVKSSAVVEPGGTVVLGGLRDIRSDANWSGLPGVPMGKTSQTTGDRRLFVVLTVAEPASAS